MTFLDPLCLLTIKLTWNLWPHLNRHFSRTASKRHLNLQIRHYYLLYLPCVLIVTQLITSLPHQSYLFLIHMINLPIDSWMFSLFIMIEPFGTRPEWNCISQGHSVLVMVLFVLYCVVEIPIIKWRWGYLLIRIFQVYHFCSSWLLLVWVWFLLLCRFTLSWIWVTPRPWSYGVFTYFKQSSFLFW